MASVSIRRAAIRIIRIGRDAGVGEVNAAGRIHGTCQPVPLAGAYSNPEIQALVARLYRLVID